MSVKIIARTELIGDANEDKDSGQCPNLSSEFAYQSMILDHMRFLTCNEKHPWSFPSHSSGKKCQDTPHSLLQPLHLERYNWQGNNLPMCRYLHPAAMETFGDI